MLRWRTFQRRRSKKQALVVKGVPDINALMTRTAMRPVPRGHISHAKALVFGLVLAACSIAVGVRKQRRNLKWLQRKEAPLFWRTEFLQKLVVILVLMVSAA